MHLIQPSSSEEIFTYCLYVRENHFVSLLFKDILLSLDFISKSKQFLEEASINYVG